MVSETWNERMARLAKKRRLLDASLTAHVDEWRTKVEKLERLEKRLLRHRDDVVVRVRVSPGPKTTIYHIDPDYPEGKVCGRVTGTGRDLSNFAQKFEGEVGSGLQRCSSCRWPTPKVAAA